MPPKIDHKPTGEVCTRCKQPARLHRKRPDRRAYYKEHNRAHPRPKNSDCIVGIDGEGQGRAPHLYNLLCAADENGRKWSVSPKKGSDRLSTVQCLDFLLALPDRCLVFGYAINYDMTKWLEDLPDRTLWLLFHEDRRMKIKKGRILYRPVKWGPYRLNYMNRKFSVAKGKSEACVWDVFAFFQSRYTKALTDWFSHDGEGKIWLQKGMGPAVARMEKMKAQRADFDKLTKEEIYGYCQEECRYLAQLGRKLIEAHQEAGENSGIDLTLKAYHGSGSTTAALLGSLGVKERRGEIPEAMRQPVASAFFGGRFENSVLGPIRGRVYNYDISSAYPYQTTFLPCLLCGRWRRVQGRGIENAIGRSTLALVRWRTPVVEPAAWGMLPVRKFEGTIAFPLAAVGGWVWKEEFLTAREINRHVEATEVWTYVTDCEHKPFELVPKIYRERVRIGKEGKGLVLKSGLNGIYGKQAQSKGVNPPFQCWTWAGNITSGTRAQLLDSFRAESGGRPEDILMFATDGIWTRARLALPQPRDTGTGDLPKPLGGWEEKSFDRGVFAVRPGIYFPLEPTDKELEKVRARGLGRKALYEQWQAVVNAWDDGAESVSLKCADRFVGVKTGVSWSRKQGARRSDVYGDWIPHTVDVHFDPRPKRQKHVNADGTLNCWPYFEVPSVPYDEAGKSPEAHFLEIAQQIAEDQADGDFAELE